MSQQSHIPQRRTIERLIHFLRGQPQPMNATPPTPPTVTRTPPTVSHAEVAAEVPGQPNRVLVERLVGYLRTTGPLESSVLLPQPSPVKPISHAPFYGGTAPEHDFPTHPVKPEGLIRAIAYRPALSPLQNPEWFPEDGYLLLRAVGGQQLGTVTLARDVLLGRAEPKPDVQMRAERINLAALVPDTSSISRIHAMLRLTDNRRVQVVDMGSTNGTFLNHRRLDSFKPAIIKDGDELQLGIFRLRLHFVRL